MILLPEIPEIVVFLWKQGNISDVMLKHTRFFCKVGASCYQVAIKSITFLINEKREVVQNKCNGLIAFHGERTSRGSRDSWILAKDKHVKLLQLLLVQMLKALMR